MKYLLPILFAFCFFSCQRHSDNWEKICDIENYIESRPDSALAVLKAIDVETLSSDEERAKYALYMSMALDKNYIDKTDFQVLQPAIDYYENHGSATDKLRTFYYQGRIFQNIGDNENAMASFVTSMDAGINSNDDLTKARNLYSQGYIYSTLYNWDKVITTSLEAAKYYEYNSLYSHYVNCITRVINAYALLCDYNSAIEYMSSCQEYLHSVNIQSLNYFYSTCLISLTERLAPKTALKLLDEYIKTVPSLYIDWLAVSKVYLVLNDINSAFDAISKTNVSQLPNREVQYYGILSRIYQHKNNHQKALEMYEKYIEISDSLDLMIFEQDTKFIEERHQLEMATIKEQEKKKQITAIFATIVSILILIAIWINSRLRLSRMEKIVAEKEAERYKLLYAQMEDERDNLNALLKQNEELDPKALNAVARRLELLNKFFTAYITDNSDIDRKASREMEELLEDKEKFMDSNRLAYAGSHPKFIKYLEDKGLTEWEINYCCLYALGLKGKEVGAYIKMRSHYNNSSEVREKLGITEHDTNLGIYIRKLVKSLSE